VLGPAYLVAVGYMDPGNWATDLAAGSTYGYQLLWIVALSSAMAMLLQSLCCRLGIATDMDLAQACARLLPSPWRLPLWLLAEVAIVACDLAELVGSAIALQMLFRVPLPGGVALTAADTLLLLALQRFGIRRLEALVIALVALIGGCFVVQVVNREKFDPILESASPFLGFSVQKYSKERIRKSKVVFDKFDYEAEFILSDPKAEFYETFRFKNGHVRRQKHEFGMPNIEAIVQMGKRAGWKYVGYQDLNPLGFEYGYLLLFEK
jgi:NRAMP (natural resistance-associated macrophage protein)-like metal ion transporter